MSVINRIEIANWLDLTRTREVESGLSPCRLGLPGAVYRRPGAQRHREDAHDAGDSRAAWA
jgi:hypothetical protein